MICEIIYPCHLFFTLINWSRASLPFGSCQCCLTFAWINILETRTQDFFYIMNIQDENIEKVIWQHTYSVLSKLSCHSSVILHQHLLLHHTLEAEKSLGRMYHMRRFKDLFMIHEFVTCKWNIPVSLKHLPVLHLYPIPCYQDSEGGRFIVHWFYFVTMFIFMGGVSLGIFSVTLMEKQFWWDIVHS